MSTCSSKWDNCFSDPKVVSVVNELSKRKVMYEKYAIAFGIVSGLFFIIIIALTMLQIGSRQKCGCKSAQNRGHWKM